MSPSAYSLRASFFISAIHACGVYGSVNDVTDEALFLRLWKQKSGQVVPVSCARIGQRLLEDVAFEHGSHIYAQGYVVILDALSQRACLDDIFMIVVC